MAIPLEVVSSTALFSNRFLLKKIGHNGTVCSPEDAVVISNDAQETVVKIGTFMSVNCRNNLCNILGKGYVYQFHNDTNGNISCNYWSGFCKVSKKQTEVIFFVAEKIVRNVV